LTICPSRWQHEFGNRDGPSLRSGYALPARRPISAEQRNRQTIHLSFANRCSNKPSHFYRTALKNREKNLTITLLKRQCRQRLEQIGRHIEALDAGIAELIAAEAALARRHQILTSIAAVGTLTANQLIATMPELGSLENKQAAALAGLAPIARQSGQWKGKSFIRGGRANVRQALYMPALVAARYNPDLKAKYQQLVTAGKPAKIAITAVMRKLVVTANALLKADRCWQQSLA
jgi:transposase